MASVLLLVATSPAIAASRYGLFTTRPQETTGILTGQDGNAMDYEVWVYALGIFADDATNAVCGLYDVDTYVELIAATAYARDEIGEPTQSDFNWNVYDQPIRFEDGLGMVISVGIGFVRYGPAP